MGRSFAGGVVGRKCGETCEVLIEPGLDRKHGGERGRAWNRNILKDTFEG